MRKLLCVSYFISVCLTVCVGYELIQWQMANVCGITIARGRSSGELLFRADDFSSRSDDTCMVVVKLEDVGIRERTVLYFTEFKLDTSCRDNVTVAKGDWSEEMRGKPSEEDSIAGLPLQLCGHNKSLEAPEARFFIDGRVFTVVYRGESAPTKNETFAMRFATYHEGECNTDRFHRCSNGHCILKDLRCHGGIDACGEKDSNCPIEDENTFLINVKDFIIDVIKIVAIVITLGTLSWIFYQRCKTSHGNIRNFPIIRDFLSKMKQLTTRPETPESEDLAPRYQNNDVNVIVEEETEIDQSISSASSFSVTSPLDNATSYSAQVHNTLNIDNYMTPPGDDVASSQAQYDTFNFDNNMTSLEDTTASAPAYDTLHLDNYITPLDTAMSPSAPSNDIMNFDNYMTSLDGFTSPSAPSYDTLNFDNNMTSSRRNNTSPSAPPFDTTTGYPPPPSYDEFMANQELYRHDSPN